MDVPSGTATSRPSVSLDPQDHSRHGMDYGGGNGVSDPLGRLDSSRPIVAFGFGGSLVTMFPQQVQRFNHYGSDGALKIAPGMLCVRRIADCIPLEHCAQGLPPLASTPLLTGDTARSTLEKHRDTAIACAKAFLDSPSSAHALGPVERALYGVAVAVLRAADQPDLQSQPLHEAIDAIRPLLAQRQQPGPQEQTMQQATVPISHGSAQDVAEVEAMLLAGKRSEAIDAACRRGMWAHALIVASCTGKKDWQAIVSAYTASVLSGGFDALGAQYRLFSGMGGHAFDDPQALRQAAADSTFVTAADIDSPGTRGGPPLGHPDPGAGGAISDWARTLALALANRSPNDQAAILGLGDRLRESGQTGAAHICYVLTLQGKGLFVPESDEATPRAILLGASEVERSSGGGAPFGMAQTRYSRYYRSHTAIFLTELYELAFALRAVASGDAQAAAPAAAKILCLPHLQAYKLHRAWWLADCGQVAQASHYCDAVLDILATLPRGTAIPFIHSALVQELRNLRDRLSGAGMTSARAAEAASGGGGGGAGLAGIGGASPKSWLARAVPRPSFASLMTAFDSSIDKFIMGADGQRIPLGAGATAGKFEIGPSRTDPRHTAGPPQPLGAAAWGGTSSSPHPQVPHLPNGGSSGSMEPHAASYAPSYAPSYASPRQSLDARPGTADLYRDNSMPPRMFTPAAFSASTGDPAPNGSAQPQWGDPTMQTSAHPGWGDPTMQSSAQPQWGDPTIQSSAQPQWGDPGSAANGTEGQDGFIVPGMAFAPSATGSTPGFGTPVPPQPVASSAAPAAPAPGAGDDDEEDMFGFKKSTSAQSARPSARPSGDGPPSKAPSARQSTDAQGGSRAEDKESGGGMLGMLKSFWGGRKTQANLGEESQFVYDPVQKRWVDKSAPAGQQDAAPPPPPPPSMMRFQPQAAATPPPPPPPGGGGNGMRSMSAAPPLPASGSPSRAGTPMSTPDVASVGGRAGRRNARSRYVDLMGQ
ncbi:hypothetical protein H4R18_002256 [Coemansia javaensis]|uniref:Protein transport protein sec16 n=1 Tax=Coemansia javaensis TaxID=2761396 RepID=A0A9W8HIX7_9FUNG|nr:hypothetical protein H4R18_002256 [Coemansia javaensis]